MKIERVLITGANGFVGRHLIAHLLESWPMASIDACVLPAEADAAQAWLSSVQPASRCDRVTWRPIDITLPEAAGELLRAAAPHAVIHLAARASGADADHEALFEVNVEGARRLLQAASGMAQPPKTLLISTGYVYGDTSPDRPAVETDAIAEEGRFGAYTDSKIAMERAARPFRDFTLIARAFAHTGPGQAPIFAIPSFCRQIARKERGLDAGPMVVGNLDALRDMLDVRDVVGAYALLLLNGAAGEVYNVGSGSPVPMRRLLDQLLAMATTEIEVGVDPNRLRAADISCSTGSSAKLKSHTGWSQAIPLEQTLEDTLNSWRGRPAND